ncbi:hypothetical protein MIMGU_mgv11b021258mg [Erythranthe guttata]|uniref:Uncharacterized protein n=1 Tax=Erythranthe guttata TaxID=4155 RepID=A0A022RSV2_ERYGU|nr:hypothetical protein MIMGU_mgv11b021258mg [Erythranthe guttata]
MSDRYKHQQLRIGLVSPQQIGDWATKRLPANGNFLVYKNLNLCLWKLSSNRNKKEDPKFCEQCGVDFADSRI